METRTVTELIVTFEADEARQVLDYINQNRKPDGAVADLYAVVQEFVSPRIGG